MELEQDFCDAEWNCLQMWNEYEAEQLKLKNTLKYAADTEEELYRVVDVFEEEHSPTRFSIHS